MKHITLFNLIAPVYAWFYRHQRKAYAKAAQYIMQRHPLSSSLLDVGCGTGALSALLCDHFRVSAVDGAEKMIEQAKRLHPQAPITFQVGNLLEGLAYDDHSVDVVMTSFVLHGLSPQERQQALTELLRISRREVIVVDYYRGRHVMIDLIERLENGHYFSFLETFEELLSKQCTHIEIIPLNATSALYCFK